MAVHDVTIEKTIMALLDDKKYQTLKDILVTMEPTDIVAVFEELEEERMPLLFRLLPKETAAEVFAELDPDWQELLIKGFSDTELKEVVDELYVDDAADLVDEIAPVVAMLLHALQFAAYAEHFTTSLLGDFGITAHEAPV